MSASLQIQARDPQTRSVVLVQAAFDVRIEIDRTGTAIGAYLLANGPKGQTEYDITRQFWAAVSGKPSAPPFGRTLTYLRTFYDDPADGLVLAVHSNSGFAVGDPVMLFDDINRDTMQPINSKAALVSAVGGSDPNFTITLLLTGGATSIGKDYPKGSYLCNLKTEWFGSSVGSNEERGVKASYESPPVPTWSVTAVSSPSRAFRFVINNPHVSASDPATAWFDIYVRPNLFTQIKPNWTPDASDLVFTDTTTATLTQDVTTHSGGTGTPVPDEDTGAPAGGTLAASTEYWMAVVRKDKSGVRQLKQPNESDITIVRLKSTA